MVKLHDLFGTVSKCQIGSLHVTEPFETIEMDIWFPQIEVRMGNLWSPKVCPAVGKQGGRAATKLTGWPSFVSKLAQTWREAPWGL